MRQIKIIFSGVVVVLLAFVLQSCGIATIIHGSRYYIPIQSSPSHANVKVVDRDGEEVYKGVTPAVVRVRTGDVGYWLKNYHTITFTKEGYDEKIVRITPRKRSFHYHLVQDPSNGAMWHFDHYGYKGWGSSNEPTIRNHFVTSGVAGGFFSKPSNGVYQILHPTLSDE